MAGPEISRIGGILLAAGGSSRLGEPKQFLQFRGKSLLRHAAEAIVLAGCDPVVAVIGAEVAGAALEIEGLGLTVALNVNWQSGMGSSIAAGLAKLIEIEPDIEAVVISLCDQPLVDSEMLALFGTKFSLSRAPVIAASYNGVAGVPALFSRELFDELLILKGDKGARDLIRNRSDIETIDLPEAAFDVDTQDDARRL